MRIAITGSNGQLGRALRAELADEELLLIDLPEHDISDLSAIVETMTSFGPDAIIHGAAITNVDGCETDPDLAYRVNVLGTRNMAAAAIECDARLAYVSTDYVFDGTRNDPYREWDATNPLSVYGRTKAIGEEIVRQMVPRHYVARTAWLYHNGGRNFCETVIRLAEERDRLHMVTDELGSPTYAPDLAAALAALLRMPAYGTYHLTNAGFCSRYEWARAILALAEIDSCELVPSENYVRAARVPKHAQLRNFNGAEVGVTLRPWREALEVYFANR